MLAATKTLSMELAPKGIRVNAIAPGVIDTAMTKGLPEDVMDRMLFQSDLKRVGAPEEVASLIVFLASDKSSFITGQIIRVDGGIG
jgi:3-oxoacyl-[acyl-carrier protein] reductase